MSEILKEMRDAYWGAKDAFEHDIKELAYGYISPEEFETKWRPRLNQEQDNVREFHAKFGFTINRRPTKIDPELGEVRHKHTLKEMDELLAAIEAEDLVEIADALADIKYFINGTGVAYGINLQPIEAEIHRSNMTKTRPDQDKYVDAKAVKGENYSPPDIASIIAEQLNPDITSIIASIKKEHPK